jgi:glutamine synthetase
MTVAAQPGGCEGAAALLERLRTAGAERVRIGWCDLHGALRGKTVTLDALPAVLAEGVSLVSTILLKDTSDRTAVKVFEPGALAAAPGLAGFGAANNLVLRPDLASLVPALPWAPGTAWLRGDLFFDDGTPVAADPRRVLVAAAERLRQTLGATLVCGLEIEFHVYRIDDARLDPDAAAWPGEPPRVSLVHPGYNLLAEGCADLGDEVSGIVERTCRGLGLPLRSFEVELGPSQFEAVFEPAEAVEAADRMVRFRNGVKQALRRAGYHASFVCRPPFAHVMASGWHLHHSLRGAHGNLFTRDAPAPGSGPADAGHWLADTGVHWLAGLLAHARGACLLASPTVNAYGRFRPGAMAPTGVLWGRDNRGAMLRVLGGAGDAATRIENRAGEPLANPYLYMAAQILAGLDGARRRLGAPPASVAPYAEASAAEHTRLPASLAEALAEFEADRVLCEGLGAGLVTIYGAIKRSEIARHDAAADKTEWMRREYFARF